MIIGPTAESQSKNVSLNGIPILQPAALGYRKKNFQTNGGTVC